MAKKRTVAKTHHKSKADWKFIITLAVLVLIGVGVFSIYRGLAATNPEMYSWGFPKGHYINTAQKKWEDENYKNKDKRTPSEQNQANKDWQEILDARKASN